VPPASRRLPREPGCEREAAERLRGRTPGRVGAVTARVPKAGKRAVDDVRADLAELFVVQAPRLHDARREVLDHNVADGDEALEDVEAERVADVEENALLVAVEVVEEAGVVERRGVADDGPPEPDGIDRLGVFDADHLGAEVGEDPGGSGPGDDPGEVADTD